MHRISGRLRALASLTVATLAAGTLHAAERDNLDQALRRQAPKIVQHLRDKGCKNIGVLKFLVRRGDGPWRDNAGMLNRSLAHRLEVALVLALPDDKVGIITRASDAVAASGNLRATHRTDKGRAEFFRINPKYFQRAWGEEGPVQPDAFLTGEVTIAADWRGLRVKVQAFDHKAPEQLVDVCEFSAAGDARMLTETGVSYVRTRGAKDDDDDQLIAKAPKATPAAFESERPDQEKVFAEVLKQCPIRITVLYNNKEAPMKAGAVPTPAPGDKVTFRLQNKGDDTCGVVLMVNGRNTLFQEEGPALECHKWVLEPGKTVLVDGFQKDDGKAERFEVKSPLESKGYAVQYGEHAGTFSLVVFRAARKDEMVLVKNEDERTRQWSAVSRGTLSTGPARAKDLKSLQADLDKESKRAAKTRGSRGLIVAGGEGDSKIQRVPFTPYPREQASLTIRYYQPK